MPYGRLHSVTQSASSWIPASLPHKVWQALVKLWRKRLLPRRQENEICYKWLHYSDGRGRAFIVFPLMRSLWNSTRKRDFCPESCCQVSGRLKTVWTGYQPSQMSVLTTLMQLCPCRPHMWTDCRRGRFRVTRLLGADLLLSWHNATFILNKQLIYTATPKHNSTSMVNKCRLSDAYVLFQS